MSEHGIGSPNNPLPTWEVIAAIRETLGRIETKVDFALAQTPLIDAKVTALESKQYALEQSRISLRADVEAVRAESALLRQTLDAYELPPAHFKLWKMKVDEVVVAFNNNQFAVSVKQQIRKQDVALMAGIASIAGFMMGSLPTIINLVRG